MKSFLLLKFFLGKARSIFRGRGKVAPPPTSPRFKNTDPDPDKIPETETKRKYFFFMSTTVFPKSPFLTVSYHKK